MQVNSSSRLEGNRMQQQEMNLIDFMDRFKTEEDCREHFFRIRWPNGFKCPKCQHEEYTLIKGRNLYQVVYTLCF